MSNQKQYLGDSVYADTDGNSIILTTENGYPDDPRNKIILDRGVYVALQQYVNWLQKIHRDGEGIHERPE